MNSSIQRLAQFMQVRQEQGEPPYVLLLGSSLSLTPAVRRAFARAEEWGAFWTEMQRTSLTERKALLRGPLNALGLEKGYQAVAWLAKAGYFDLILTLNVDDTIDDVMRPLPADQSVVLVYDGSNAAHIVEVLFHPTPRIKVVKLHGDINARKLPLTPQAQFEFPQNLEDAVTRWLSRDTIVVGDLPFDDDVRRCLRSGDALWCILPDKPTNDSFIMRAKQNRLSGEIISGVDAEFNTFFTALAERLLSNKVLHHKDASFEVLWSQFVPVADAIRILDKESKKVIDPLEEKLSTAFDLITKESSPEEWKSLVEAISDFCQYTSSTQANKTSMKELRHLVAELASKIIANLSNYKHLASIEKQLGTIVHQLRQL